MEPFYKIYSLYSSTKIWQNIENRYGTTHQSTIHAIISTTLGILGILSERHYILNNVIDQVTIGYFIADIISCKLKKDMIFHHILGILMIFLMSTRYPNSPGVCQAILLEGSTPFLNEFRRTKKYIWGYGLLISFFLLRIVWLPYIVHIFITHEQPDIHVNIKRLLYIFIGLNYYWFYKICTIAYKFV